jgi:hypothetical protein
MEVSKHSTLFCVTISLYECLFGFHHFELFKDVIYDTKNLVIDVYIQIVPTIK